MGSEVRVYVGGLSLTLSVACPRSETLEGKGLSHITMNSSGQIPSFGA